MLDPNFLKAAKENVTIYPNRPAVKCDMIGNDNAVFETLNSKTIDSHISKFKMLT